jgi:myo-inositol 2-dehydrogenase/D-chiro-inositol 1-dehydrogenase
MSVLLGAVVTIFMSRSANYGYDQRCEIFGSQGMIQVQNINETACVLSDQTGIHHSKYQHSFPQRFHQAFGLEMNAFADTILLEKDWPITQDDCVYVQQIADAAQESCRTGSPVELKSFIIAQQDLWRLKDNDNTIAMT